MYSLDFQNEESHSQVCFLDKCLDRDYQNGLTKFYYFRNNYVSMVLPGMEAQAMWAALLWN